MPRPRLLLGLLAGGPFGAAQPPPERQIKHKALPRVYPPFEGKADLTGVALRTDGKTPWTGAEFELFWFGDGGRVPLGPPQWDPHVATVTDRNGRFGFDRLPDGRYL